MGRRFTPSRLCKDISTSCLSMMLEISTLFTPARLFRFLMLLRSAGRPSLFILVFLLLLFLIVQIGKTIGFLDRLLFQRGINHPWQRLQVCAHVFLLPQARG